MNSGRGARSAGLSPLMTFPAWSTRRAREIGPRRRFPNSALISPNGRGRLHKTSNCQGRIMPRTAPPRRRREFAVTRHILTLLLITASSLALAGSPHLVLDINSQYTALDSSPVWLGKLGSSYYFIAHPVPTTAAGGDALFKTDGTATGTSLVAPIDGLGVLTNQAGPLFIPAGTKAYFLA